MTTFLWKIAPELEQLRRQMDELFDGSPTAEQQSVATWQPRAEVWELSDRYQIKLQVPGIDPNQIEIEASRDRVSIKGDRKAPETTAKAMHSEFHYGPFERSFRLSKEVQHQQVTASYGQGILTLSLPKLTAATDLKVKVQISSLEDSAQDSAQDSSQDSDQVPDKNAEPTGAGEDVLHPVW